MRHKLVAAFAVVFAFAAEPAMAADPITTAEAAQHVGETATVVGVLNGYHHGGKKRPTYWNIDGAYPNNAFTVLIPSDDAYKFPNVGPLIGKKLAITGTIQLHDGKPQIVVEDLTQVQVEQ